VATMNYEDAVMITDDIYWVGFYDQGANLHCNPYLLIDEQDVILIDPGSIPYFPKIMRKVIDLVDPEIITAVIISHQDPDVCGNLAVLEEVIDRPDTKIIAHTNTIRLIRHYGLKSQYYAADEHGYRYTLKSGRVLQFLHTPYLHSPGAIMTYDVNSKSLFTSDVFGAISNNWSLFASMDDLEPMKLWHQAYMPSNSLLRGCMNRLEKMEIQRLLPQHGSVFKADDITAAIEFLKHLPCGLDLNNQLA
jgi:flavorubredoxin